MAPSDPYSLVDVFIYNPSLILKRWALVELFMRSFESEKKAPILEKKKNRGGLEQRIRNGVSRACLRQLYNYSLSSGVPEYKRAVQETLTIDVQYELTGLRTTQLVIVYD